MEKLVVATDLDGTLVYTSTDATSSSHDSTLKALHRLNEAGAQVIPFTGRGPVLAATVLAPLGLGIHPGAFHHGAITYDTKGKIVLNEPLPSNIVDTLLQVQDELKSIKSFDYSSSGTIMLQTLNDHYLGEDVKGIGRKNMSNHGSKRVKTIADSYKGQDVYQGSFQFFSPATDEQFEIVRNAMKKCLTKNGLHDVSIFISGRHFMDIISGRADKAYALAALGKELGFTNENVYAIGDSENDMKMLNSTKNSIAMGNALPVVKNQCAHVVKHVNEGGWSEAIDTIVLKSIE